jgi:hypothetical protein
MIQFQKRLHNNWSLELSIVQMLETTIPTLIEKVMNLHGSAQRNINMQRAYENVS